MHSEGKKSESKKASQAQKKRDWRNEKIFGAVCVALGLLFLAYQQHKPPVIGHSLLYVIFIQVLPSLIGGLALTAYFTKGGINETVALWKKTLGFGVVFLCASLFSFAALGLPADAGFNYLNYKVAKKQPVTIVTLPVAKFHEGHGRRATYKIYFDFEGNTESLSTSHESIKYYIAHKDKKNYIRINIRKGIWNYYLVEDWAVVE
jgi:hypothetical protein